MIRFEQVSKTYPGGFHALKNVSFIIEKGEMIFIAGHSGAGKSTLLKLISGITKPTSGKVRMNNQDIGALNDNQLGYLRQHIGIVFQDHKILFDRNVLQNVLLPLRIIGYDHKQAEARAKVAIAKVGLTGKEHADPITLSGGEQQRVGIARAVVNKPAVLLADEPTGNLDDALSEGILRLFEEFNRVGVTVLMATHDINLISRRSYRMLTLSDGHLHGGVGHE